MKKLTLCVALIVGITNLGLADDPAVPAVNTEAVAAVKTEAAPQANAGQETPTDSEAKPEAPTESPEPAATPATEKPQPPSAKNDALTKAAEDDPDVAARMETPYPLDGEEWREYPLGVLEMEMQEVIEDLSSGKPKPPSLVTQPRIISRLDVMIAELEKKTGGGKGSNNSGNKPAEKSVLRKGSMKEGQMRAVRNEGDRWADIPAKEREKILQSQGEGFPAGYEDVLADYFRKLSKSEKPAAAAPPATPGGSR